MTLLVCASVLANPGPEPTAGPPLSASLHNKYGFRPAPGVLPTTSSSVSCQSVCDRIEDYDPFFGVVRLSGGGFAALRREADNSLSWRVGNELSEVSGGVLKDWRSNKQQPNWTPELAGLVLAHVAPIKDSDSIFVGVWEPEHRENGQRLVALFTDREDRRIAPLNVAGACVIATLESPVVALGTEASLHGEMWPVRLIVRASGESEAATLAFVFFPKSIKCVPPVATDDGLGSASARDSRKLAVLQPVPYATNTAGSF